MTITYTFQYKLFPMQWSAPKPPETSADEQEDILRVLEYRRIIAPYLKNWLSLLNTWKSFINYCVIPAHLLLALMMGMGIGWFLIISLIIGLVSFSIWARIRAYHATIAMIEIVIDEVIAENLGYKPPKILENE